MSQAPIFHIAARADFETMMRDGYYAPVSFDDEGFIHCSYAEQVCDVANARFQGQVDLVLIAIDRALLACPVVDEDLYGHGSLFPHIYGPLPIEAVTAIHDFAALADGRFVLPEAIIALD
ncbi:MAG: DUF952 domain-containing protein [Pseudomonadota bacterium]